MTKLTNIFSDLFAVLDTATEQQHDLYASTFGMPETEKQVTIAKAEENHKLIVDWRGLVEELRDEMMSSGVFGEMTSPPQLPPTSPPPQNGERIGEYVRRKMSELSESGYVFTPDMLNVLLTQLKPWGRTNTRYCFARRYAEGVDIPQQICCKTL
jgi:hypothetical protein